MTGRDDETPRGGGWPGTSEPGPHGVYHRPRPESREDRAVHEDPGLALAATGQPVEARHAGEISRLKFQRNVGWALALAGFVGLLLR